jgi:ABC-type glycerol-3-phosphate transport system permease component
MDVCCLSKLLECLATYIMYAYKMASYLFTFEMMSNMSSSGCYVTIVLPGLVFLFPEMRVATTFSWRDTHVPCIIFYFYTKLYYIYIYR